LPTESARLRRRVRPRDLWFIGVVSGSGSTDPRSSGGGCVSTIEAGFMGGQTHRYCGAAAVTFCRRTLRESRAPDECEAVLARVSD
jgi:hypothetical protein